MKYLYLVYTIIIIIIYHIYSPINNGIFQYFFCYIPYFL